MERDNETVCRIGIKDGMQDMYNTGTYKNYSETIFRDFTGLNIQQVQTKNTFRGTIIDLPMKILTTVAPDEYARQPGAYPDENCLKLLYDTHGHRLLVHLNCSFDSYKSRQDEPFDHVIKTRRVGKSETYFSWRPKITTLPNMKKSTVGTTDQNFDPNIHRRTKVIYWRRPERKNLNSFIIYRKDDPIIMKSSTLIQKVDKPRKLR